MKSRKASSKFALLLGCAWTALFASSALAALSVLMLCATPLAAAPSSTPPTVTGIAYVRLPAPDLARTADFYKAAFGMREVMRIKDHEISLNVGANDAAARANPNARVVLDGVTKFKPEDKDRLVLVLHARNVAGVVERAKSLGAEVLMQPSISGISDERPNGYYVAIIRDIAGNRVKLFEER